MFTILVTVVIPHLYRYEVRLTNKYMFKSLGKRCYRSRNIGTGMLDQIHRPCQTVQGQQYFPFYQHVCSKSDDSQISKSQICIIHFFFKDNCCPDGFCQYL